ncbi:ferredoxin 1b [Hypomesus transpacificus]|uniref:ferredoxin 1b n=1 Tax=Hypomesus transpacificus TaxID=137520 RepID=UPI001F079DC3|nr:ferredoxin 1b [Hypomesus transpacificus]
MAKCFHLRSALLRRMPGLLWISGIQGGCIHARIWNSQARILHSQSVSCSDSKINSLPVDKVTIHFVNQDGIKTTTAVNEGQSLLDVVVNKNVDISGFGACEGTLACSTCHLVFEKKIHEKMEPMVDEEMDMLDLAYGLTKTSRLGCQVTVQRWMDGMTVYVPREMRNALGSKDSS